MASGRLLPSADSSATQPAPDRCPPSAGGRVLPSHLAKPHRGPRVLASDHRAIRDDTLDGHDHVARGSATSRAHESPISPGRRGSRKGRVPGTRFGVDVPAAHPHFEGPLFRPASTAAGGQGSSAPNPQTATTTEVSSVRGVSRGIATPIRRAAVRAKHPVARSPSVPMAPASHPCLPATIARRRPTAIPADDTPGTRSGTPDTGWPSCRRFLVRDTTS